MSKRFVAIVFCLIFSFASLPLHAQEHSYRQAMDRARSAEARTILGQIRAAAAAYRLEYGSLDGFDNEDAGIGESEDEIPSACRPTHYFRYEVNRAEGATVKATATRCVQGGKEPQGTGPDTLSLTTNFAAGTDVWGGTLGGE